MSTKVRCCIVCKAEIKFGRTCEAPSDCATKFREFLAPKPEHSTLERDKARERFAQSDRAPTEDVPRTRSKPA